MCVDFAYGRLGVTNAQPSLLAHVGLGVLISRGAGRLLAVQGLAVVCTVQATTSSALCRKNARAALRLDSYEVTTVWFQAVVRKTLLTPRP